MSVVFTVTAHLVDQQWIKRLGISGQSPIWDIELWLSKMKRDLIQEI